MNKYLRVVLTIGEVKEYEWDDVEFGSNREDDTFRVWESETGETLLVVPSTNVEYYERIMR